MVASWARTRFPEAGLSEADRQIRLDDRQRRAWLRLIRTEGVGPITFRQLLNHFGSADAALDALPELARRGGGDASRLRVPPTAAIEAEFEAAARFGVRYVALGEPDYPPLLRGIEGPPPLLAVKGGTGVLTRPTAAIVGARNASIAGRKMAGLLARGLGAAGFVVVSGLARGIDAAAHEAALDTGTIACMAGGLDRLYPPENAGLYDAIVESGGAAISEMPMGWAPRAKDFPRRNRLISGLSLGVTVVEAAARSGSLLTCRYAAEQGREVTAVPGSPLDPRSEGANRLIREGSTLVTSAADVIEALTPLVDRVPYRADDLAEPAGPEGPFDAPADVRARILDALGPTPVTVDEIIRMTGAEPVMVQLVILELDLGGRLERHPGGKVSLVY